MVDEYHGLILEVNRYLLKSRNTVYDTFTPKVVVQIYTHFAT